MTTAGSEPLELRFEGQWRGFAYWLSYDPATRAWHGVADYVDQAAAAAPLPMLFDFLGSADQAEAQFRQLIDEAIAGWQPGARPPG